MVKKTEEPEEAKPQETLEERSLRISLAVMANIQSEYIPKAKLALFRNRNSNRPLEHLYYDGYRDGLAKAVLMLLSGQLDMQEPKDDEG